MLLRSNFSPFPQYFQYIFLIKGVYLHIHLLNLVVQFVFSSILKICYVEVRISRSISNGPFKFEITRVDCNSKQSVEKKCNRVNKNIRIQTDKLKNVCTVTHQSNSVDVKSNGRDGDDIDILVIFNEITHNYYQTWWCPL